MYNEVGSIERTLQLYKEKREKLLKCHQAIKYTVGRLNLKILTIEEFNNIK